MTDQHHPSLGTVAEEAARLITAVATMARSGANSGRDEQQDQEQDPRPYAGGPAQEPDPPARDHPSPEGHTSSRTADEPADGPSADEPSADERPADERPADQRPADQPSDGAPFATGSSGDGRSGPTADSCVCSTCGGSGGGTPVACKLCPFCQGIALLRTIQPETVDRLADLASALATSLRDMASRSRSASTASETRSGPRRTPGSGRATVQDIPVDDEGEGWRT